MYQKGGDTSDATKTHRGFKEIFGLPVAAAGSGGNPDNRSKNRTATAVRVRLEMEELPARANIAMSEEREEIIPMRECEQTSAVNMETARKSKKTRGGSSLADKSRRAFSSLRSTALRSLPASRKARATTNRSVISKKPAE